MSIVNLAPGGRISLISHYAPGGKNVLLFHLASGGKNTRYMRPLWGRFIFDYKHVTPLGSFIFALLLWGHMYLNIASGGNNFSNKHFSPIAKVAHQKEAI